MEKARGQILVLMAMLSTTLIIFFGMVIAIGHLIQARINLQNSVDFAAMVGASYQARYLNGISVINYRMRQNYKFVLSDLYVTQSRFNKGFKDNIQGGASSIFDQVNENGKLVFGICQQYPGYAPNVELAYGAQDRAFPETDMCKFVGSNTGIPHIQWTPVPSLNPFVLGINLANQALSEEVKKTCGDAAGQNEDYFKYIIEKLKNRNEIQQNALEGVIGDFSSAFSNSPNVLGSSNPADAAVAQTFTDNLISANLASGAVKLEYLNPSSTRAPPAGAGTNSLDYFEVQETSFTVRSVNFVNTANQCKAQILNNQSGPIRLGIARSRAVSGSGEIASTYRPPKIPFFVALKATVRPNLLFWPTGLTPTIVAVGAAKPFGSRIGPFKQLSNLELTGNVGGVGGNTFANISFYPGDFEGQRPGVYGMGNKTILRELYKNLPPASNSGKNAARPSISNAPDFVNMSLAPTLFEGLFWSVFPDPAGANGRGPADVAMYPHDGMMSTLLSMANPQFNQIYLLPDRQGASSPARPSLWHYVDPRYGLNPVFREGNKPLFYADYVSVASAFNPGVYPPDAAQVSTFLGNGGAAGDLRGRTGYQIKLASIPQLCEEISAGDSGAIGDLGGMQQLCQKPYKVWY